MVRNIDAPYQCDVWMGNRPNFLSLCIKIHLVVFADKPKILHFHCEGSLTLDGVIYYDKSCRVVGVWVVMSAPTCLVLAIKCRF